MKTLDIFLFAINSIFPLIGIILLGYLLKQKGFLTKEFLKVGSKVVFRICLPVLLFCNITELENLSGIPWNTVIYVFGIVAILFVIGLLVTKTTSDPKQKGVMLQCIFRSNFALIGIPLAELLGGRDGIVVAAILSVFTIPLFNVLAVLSLTMYLKKEGKNAIKGQLMSIAKNPLIIGVCLGILFQLFKSVAGQNEIYLALSNLIFLKTMLNFLSRMATPLALLVLGGQFEFERIGGYKLQIISAVVGRTIAAPLLGVGIAALLTRMGWMTFSASSFAALIALFGTPVAVASAIMAEEMDNDGQLAAQLVIWTSLISVFTLFVIIFVTRAMGFLG